MIPMYEDKIEDFLTFKLNLSDNANFNRESALNDADLPIRVNYFIKDKGLQYFVELKSRANVNSIAQLVFLKEWLKEAPGKKKFILIGKQITPRIKEMGEKMGIEVLELSYDIEIHEKVVPTKKGKLTTEKSWKIIMRLLKEKGISIRKLSIQENVSYAWTHATVQNLLSRDIATKKGNFVMIKDIPQLLNGIAWERPFEDLFYEEIYVSYDDAYVAGKVLTGFLKNYNIQFSFTAYTAAGQYSGYGKRLDTLYMYIDKAQADKFKKEFRANKGIKLRLYLPDRDVFKESQEIDGIQVASFEQVILDMIGFGYSGRDITKALVDEYANK